MYRLDLLVNLWSSLSPKGEEFRNLSAVETFHKASTLSFVAYLNTVVVKTDGMRKESGRISNVELRSQISNVFYYLCVVIIQLIAPLILILSIQLLAISLSGGCMSTA